MLSPDLDSISIEQIQALLESGTPERKQLEFKRQLNPRDNGHKEKFLAEVTSFANTTGGDLLIGVPDPDDIEDEEDEKLWWTTDHDRDQYKLDWENIIRNNTQPRLNTHEIRTIPNPDGEGYVAVIRVQQSTISPHRVTLKSKKPFYARNSAGKYPLDVGELREKFLEQYRLTEEVEQFLADRTAKIRSADTPAPFEPGPCMVLHVIPATAFSMQPEIDISKAEQEIAGLPLFHRDRGNIHSAAKRNIDGIVNSQDIKNFSKRSGEDNPSSEYVQLFRDGRIEAVHSFHFRNQRKDEDRIGFLTLYEILQDRLPDYTGFLYDLDVRTPIFLYLSFLDADGFYLALGENRESSELDRAVATLPAVTLESYDVSSDEVVEEFLTHVWHAFGELGDPFDYFDKPDAA
ncbi:RNA-binding domain-containing protein [Haloplanus halobius]|uniref:RNA-binding domain-containing protein n=1 Tax=Haloplanus halobius TaxID=2934938 RepID=UPI00200E9D90|nr:RNA-binding domain-containing protein [Haloplanus sp. XH21]